MTTFWLVPWSAPLPALVSHRFLSPWKQHVVCILLNYCTVFVLRFRGQKCAVVQKTSLQCNRCPDADGAAQGERERERERAGENLPVFPASCPAMSWKQTLIETSTTSASGQCSSLVNFIQGQLFLCILCGTSPLVRRELFTCALPLCAPRPLGPKSGGFSTFHHSRRRSERSKGHH